VRWWWCVPRPDSSKGANAGVDIGEQVLTSDDLPTPDWPTKTLIAATEALA
jgi:hypothetical protein